MVNNSQTYLDYINQLTRTTQIEITAHGTLFSSERFTDENIVNGSVSWNTKSINNSIFSNGTTYASEFKISFIKNSHLLLDTIARFDGADLSVKFKLMTSQYNHEDVSIGTFYVKEAVEHDNQFDITAYDFFGKGDTDISNRAIGYRNSLTPDSVFSMIHSASLSQYGEVGSLRNTSYVDSISPTLNGEIIKFGADKNTFATAREALSDICNILGGFATMNRETSTTWSTRVCFKRYGGNTDTVNLNNNHIRKLHYNKNKVFQYTGVIMYSEEIPYTAGNVDIENGAKPYIFTTKLMHYNTAAEKQAVVDNLWNNVYSTFSFIQLDLEYFGDPSIELGDKVVITDGNETIESYVMSIDWKWRGTQSLETAEKIETTSTSSNDKEIEHLQQSIQSIFKIIPIVNSNAINVGSSGSSIYSGSVQIGKQNYSYINGVIEFDSDEDELITLVYRIGSTYPSYQYQIKSGKTYIPVFKTFELTDLDNATPIQILINKGGSTSTVTIGIGKLNLAIVGAIK